MIFGILIGIALGIGQAHWALWPSRSTPKKINPKSIVSAFVARLFIIIVIGTGAILFGASIYTLLFGMIVGYLGRLFFWLRMEAI